MRTGRSANRLLARKLAGAIDGQRIWQIVFAPGTIAAAVEHVIGGEVDERHPAARRPPGNDARGLGIDAKRQVSFVFGAIDRRIGGRIHDQVRADAIECRSDLFELRKIEFVSAGGDDGSDRLESFEQRAANLPGYASYHRTHQRHFS